MENNFIVHLTEVNSFFLTQYVPQGEVVVDATMGNGQDTLMIAKLVGEKGKVYAFDIQQEALNRTKMLLEKEKMSMDGIVLINDSHENIQDYIHEPICAAVFNLGYLPKGNHAITTETKSTLLALEGCLNLLKVNGLISILIYEGHDKACVEKEAVLDFAQHLDSKKYHTLYLDMVNQKNQPPSLLLITKKKKGEEE